MTLVQIKKVEEELWLRQETDHKGDHFLYFETQEEARMGERDYNRDLVEDRFMKL